MTVQYRLTKKQTDAHIQLTNEKNNAVCYGGSKGGGKSFLLCLWAWQWTLYLIEFFGITKSNHPPPLGFIGRKRSVDFNDTTFETFKRIIPPETYVIRDQDKEIVVNGRAKIAYGGLDDQININKFNSAEYCFIAIDQAEETLRQDVSVLQATLRFRMHDKTPFYKELYTANPAECWLKDDFIIGNRENGVFIPALPDDNPYLPGNYKDTLKNAFAYDPALLKAYLYGDWDAFANLSDSLIRAKWVEDARKNTLREDEEGSLRIISVDVATKHGENETVILYRYGHTIKDIWRFKKIPTTKIAMLAKSEYEKHKCHILVVDSDGIGEGVSDILLSQNIGVCEFHGGTSSKPLDQHRYRNLRSQFYDITAKKLESGLFDFTVLPEKDIFDVKRQLCTVKVKPPDPMARIQIMSKEEMLKLGIVSPDIADAIVYSEYGFYMGNYSQVKAYSYR